MEKNTKRKQAEEYFIRARNLWRDKNISEAEINYRQAIEVDPSFAVAYYDLATLLDKNKGAKREIIAYYQNFINLAKDNKNLFDQIRIAEERMTANKIDEEKKPSTAIELNEAQKIEVEIKEPIRTATNTKIKQKTKSTKKKKRSKIRAFLFATIALVIIYSLVSALTPDWLNSLGSLISSSQNSKQALIENNHTTNNEIRIVTFDEAQGEWEAVDNKGGYMLMGIEVVGNARYSIYIYSEKSETCSKLNNGYLYESELYGEAASNTAILNISAELKCLNPGKDVFGPYDVELEYFPVGDSLFSEDVIILNSEIIWTRVK